MPGLKLLNEVAYMEEDCPRCGGSSSGVRSGQEGRYPLDCACSLCGGSGKVFVLPEMVRVECPTCSKVRNRGGTILHCSECSDGTVASEKMQDWMEAVDKPITFVPGPDGRWKAVILEYPGVWGDGPFTALVMAIKAVKHEQ